MDVKRIEYGLQPGQRRIKGGFLFNGSSDPATTTGKGFTVAHASTGVWTVTLDEAPQSYVDFSLTLNLPTGTLGHYEARIGDKSVANGTFDIEVLFSANTSTTHPVAADVAAATDTGIYFEVVVAKGSQVGNG